MKYLKLFEEFAAIGVAPDGNVSGMGDVSADVIGSGDSWPSLIRKKKKKKSKNIDTQNESKFVDALVRHNNHKHNHYIVDTVEFYEVDNIAYAKILDLIDDKYEKPLVKLIVLTPKKKGSYQKTDLWANKMSAFTDDGQKTVDDKGELVWKQNPHILVGLQIPVKICSRIEPEIERIAKEYDVLVGDYGSLVDEIKQIFLYPRSARGKVQGEKFGF
jgi:hypothetical protein